MSHNHSIGESNWINCNGGFDGPIEFDQPPTLADLAEVLAKAIQARAEVALGVYDAAVEWDDAVLLAAAAAVEDAVEYGRLARALRREGGNLDAVLGLLGPPVDQPAVPSADAWRRQAREIALVLADDPEVVGAILAGAGAILAGAEAAENRSSDHGGEA